MKNYFWRENPNGHKKIQKISVVIVKKKNFSICKKKPAWKMKFLPVPELYDDDCHFHSAQQPQCDSLEHQIAQKPCQFHVVLKLQENLDLELKFSAR